LQRDPARVSLSPASKTDSLRRINVLPERPMLGVELKLHPAAQTLAGTGGLVVERRVGGGARHRATPIMWSRVTSGTSSFSARPSVPAGRSGSTR